MKMMRGDSDKPVAQTEFISIYTMATGFGGDVQVIIHKKPHFHNFSRTGKDCSFSRWNYEVKLEADARYSTGVVLEAAHECLKTPTADALPRLGINPTLQQVIDTIERAYGSVLS